MRRNCEGLLEQPDLLQLEFQNVAVEGLEQILRGSLEYCAPDFACVGVTRAYEHDRLTSARGGPQTPHDFRARRAAGFRNGHDHIRGGDTAVLERVVQRRALGKLEAAFPENPPER